MLLHSGAGNPPLSSVDGTTLLDGFAALAFPIQPGGGMSLAPGSGIMTYSISASSLNSTGARQTIALDSTASRRDFKIANPLALLMNGTSDLSQAIGYSTDPKAAENLENGNPKGTVGGKNVTRLTAGTGLVSHGGFQVVSVSIVDRSLMTLLYGWDRGLSNVRVQRNELGWRGGAGAVVKPLDAILYENYEDLPTRYPNDSLDYPNMSRERISFTTNPTSNPENPIFSGVSLVPPVKATGSDPFYLARSLKETRMDVRLDVPRFQPANDTSALNSAGTNIPAGYMGTQYVYVDNGTGTFNRSGGQRNAYRLFRFAGNVDADERVSITTPVVDLGSLGQGHGYSPLAPINTSNLLLNPVQDQDQSYTGIKYFSTMTVVNEGNVNLLNLRLAKKQEYSGGSILPWPIYSLGNHESAWLETSQNVFSNLDNDTRWNVTDSNGRTHASVALQKARPGDRVGTELSLNPIRRANANLDVNQGYLTSLVPYPYLPSVAVTIPIGFPVGSYSQTMRVIEDTSSSKDYALSMDSSGAGLETYSDPTFELRFKVRESRITNSFTKGTTPMADDLVVGSERFLHRNAQPTAMRTLNGNVLTAWASTRTSWNEAEPGNDAKLDDQWRIFIANLAGTTPTSVLTSTNPLRELGSFVPNASTNWFEKLSVSPFPTCTTDAQANALFNIDTSAGNSILINTVKFGSPSFPTNGMKNPLTNASTSSAYMAFIGEAQVQGASGRGILYKLFIAPVTSGSSGSPTVGAPIMAAADDSHIQKSKPSLIQVDDHATILFGGGSAGQTQLMYVSYDPTGGWTPVRSFSTGGGFEYTTSPSVSMRQALGQYVLEIAFVGKLRGRANSEVFFGRVISDANGLPQGNNSPTFAMLPSKDRETLTSTGVAGVYRTDGVAWNIRSTIKLEQVLNGTTTDLEVAGTRTYDQATGMIVFTTKLGGKAYLDPGAGTVRLSNAIPPANAELMLSYQPRFLRISGTGVNAGHSAPSVLFDNRYVAETSYWVGLTPTTTISRYLYTYVKTSPGGGQTTRPYVKSVRLGVQLPYAIATNDNGFVTSLTVSGNAGPYQVDPANGRIFFTSIDEGNQVTVNATLKYPNGTLATGYSQTSYVSFTTEREEAPVQIEQAVNESGMYAFLDPFNLPGNYADRRPGLVWLFWTSTRAGAPDIYFETIAPRFTPVPPGK